MIGLSLNLSVDLPAVVSATLNLSEQAITQHLHLNTTSLLLNIERNATAPTTTTASQHAPQYNDATALRVIVLSALAATSLLGNLATMWNIKHQDGYTTCISGSGSGNHNQATSAAADGSRWHRRRRRRRLARHHSWSAVYFLLFHLAVADLLVTAFCIGGEAVWSYSVSWRLGVWACKGLKFAQMFSLYLSTFVLVLVGVDRWVAVKYPWKSLHMQHRCYRLLALAYALAAVLSVPQLFIFDVVRGPFVEEFDQCVTYGFYTAFWQEQLYTTVTLMCMFVVPLMVLVGTYVATFRTIAASERMFQQSGPAVHNSTAMPNGQSRSAGGETRCDFNGMAQSQSQKRQQLIHRAKIKSLRISVVIVSAFIVCWSPYYVMMMSFVFLNPDREHSSEDDLQSAIFCFGMSNSVVNPIVYGLFHLWPMRARQRRSTEDRLTAAAGGTTINTTRCSYTKEPSTNRNTALIKNNTTRPHEGRLLLHNGRNISDGSMESRIHSSGSGTQTV